MSSRLPAIAAIGLVAVVLVCASRPTQITISGPGTDLAGITVSGSAIVHRAPDVAIIDIGVAATEPTADGARSTAAARAQAIMTALRGLSIDESDIKTTNVSLYPQYDYHPCYAPAPMPAPDDPATSSGSGSSGSVGSVGAQEGRPVVDLEKPVVDPGFCDPGSSNRVIGYTFSETLEVTVRKIEAAGPAIDAATGAGSNQINGIRFDLSDRAAAERDAKAEAIKDARADAEALAAAAGLRITGVRSIGSATVSGGYRYDYASGAKDGGAPLPVSPGSLDLSADVTVVFDIGK